MFTKEAQELAKPCYEAIKKIAERQGKKWEWICEWGKWVVHNHKARIVIGINPNWITLATGNEEQAGILKSSCTPLFHWERIERMLEEMGYWLIGLDKGKSKEFHCDVMKDDSLVVASIGKTRTEAVYAAVIELGEKE